MILLAIDPGTNESAFVAFDGRPLAHGIVSNEDLLAKIQSDKQATALAVEMIASYGMPVGAEVFETCIWIGRFIQAASVPHTLIYRRDVKSHLCGSTRAKDANVRQALLDLYRERYALPTSKQVTGTKKDPGPCYGMKSHIWAALGVAETWWSMNGGR